MTKSKQKRTLREEIAFIKRAVGILNQILPHYWLWATLCVIIETFSPYFGLYMSALMVNELAADRNVHTLLTYAVITVVGGFAISLITRLIQRKRNMTDFLMWHKQECFFIDYQNQMQYEHLENPDVVLLRSKIAAASNATGGGLPEVKWNIPDLLHGIFNVVFSTSLTVSMFSMAAKENYTGFFGFINSPASALVIVALILVNTTLSMRLSSSRAKEQKEAYSDNAESNARSEAYYVVQHGADAIVFNLNRIVLDEFRKDGPHAEWLKKIEKIDIRYNSLSVILNGIMNLALYLFVAAKAFIGVFGIGNFILYQGTIGRFIGGISEIAGEVSRLKFNNTYLAQLYEYLDLPNNMYKGTLAVEKRDDIDYTIEFRDVSFKYPRCETYALRHVNLKFKIGDKLAIVGENGSGKTTFIKLLCRLYDPTEGKILLNGIDITRYRYDEYMSLFSVVFQDYTLFGFPLGENVSASNTYDEKKVRDCLIRAGMGEKLTALDNDPDNRELDPLTRAIDREYDPEAIEFSGGEQQKIAIARALYKDAPFVVLDEPTAALDPIAEAAVYENFNKMVENKTSVFISHRLSSCRFCDSIAVFDHGHLIQQGTHEDLVTQTGKYQDLWHAQAQYYEK